MSSGATRRPLRVGVAGLGFGAVHAAAFLAQPDVELAGIASRRVDKAQSLAVSLSVARACASVEELLDLELDAVSLALPPDQMAAAVRAALKRNVAVLCEKPLAQDAAVAQELADLAAGTVTAVDFIFGELETFKRMKQIVDNGLLGAVRHAEVLWAVESWANRLKKWSWKTDAARGGGVLNLLGSHVFYLAEWLLGRALTVRARTAPAAARVFAPPSEVAAEDFVRFAMTFCSGATLGAVIGNAHPGIHVHRWTVFFERGTAVLENVGVDYAAGFVLTVRGDMTEVLAEPIGGSDGRMAPLGRLIARFLAGVATRTTVIPDLAAGARVQLIDTVARLSAAEEREYDLQ